MKDLLPNFSFWQLLWRFLAAIATSVLFLVFLWFFAVPDLKQWLSDFRELPNNIQVNISSLYGFIFLPCVLFFPVAAFPPHWSSMKSTERRLGFFVKLLMTIVLVNVYARVFSEGHLQSHLLPKGYVQCETEPKGTNIMFKEYVFVKDSKLCEHGLKR